MSAEGKCKGPKAEKNQTQDGLTRLQHLQTPKPDGSSKVLKGSVDGLDLAYEPSKLGQSRRSDLQFLSNQEKALARSLILATKIPLRGPQRIGRLAIKKR